MDNQAYAVPMTQKDRLLRQHDEFVEWFNDWVSEVSFCDESVGINPPSIYQDNLIVRLKQTLDTIRTETETGSRVYNIGFTTEEIQILILAIPYLLGDHQGLDLLNPTYLNPALRRIEAKIMKETDNNA